MEVNVCGTELLLRMDDWLNNPSFPRIQPTTVQFTLKYRFTVWPTEAPVKNHYPNTYLAWGTNPGSPGWVRNAVHYNTCRPVLTQQKIMKFDLQRWLAQAITIGGLKMCTHVTSSSPKGRMWPTPTDLFPGPYKLLGNRGWEEKHYPKASLVWRSNPGPPGCRQESYSLHRQSSLSWPNLITCSKPAYLAADMKAAWPETMVGEGAGSITYDGGRVTWLSCLWPDTLAGWSAAWLVGLLWFRIFTNQGKISDLLIHILLFL